MNDVYGIGAGVEAVTEVYFRAGRSTGRTNMMVSMLKPGDVVVFDNRQEMMRVEHMIRTKGIEGVKCEMFDKSNPLGYTCQGTCYLDHSLVEQFYRDSIERAKREMSWIVDQRSKTPPSMNADVERMMFKWRP